ncbi:FAD-dependent oxidoreductase, partial [bacterium]|nr:FAD-dependent oxidoreductase [bacterium]
LIENEISRFLDSLGVRVVKESRAVDVSSQDGVLKEIVLDNGDILSGQAFVDCSGTAGPMSLCRRHGWGCVACVNRCPVFGGRVSITAKMGVAERSSQNAQGKVGVASQGMNILKETLDQGLVKELEKSAVLLIPVPPGFSEQKFEIPKGDQKSFEENLVLIDNGFAKIKSRPFIPLERLRRVRGFERAVYFDPAGGSRGNCIRFLAVAPRDMDLKVKGTKNLFAAGEKQGLLVGVCEAIVSGLLAGHNAARLARQEETLCLPRSTAVGEMLAFTQERLGDPSGYKERYSCLGGGLFSRLKEKGLYVKDRDEVMGRIKKEGLSNIL